ncbi:MAG: DUF2141 domain-containing protein [Pseudomonadota bacterium]
MAQNRAVFSHLYAHLRVPPWAQAVAGAVASALVLVFSALQGAVAYADDFAPGNPFNAIADPAQPVLAVQTTFDAPGAIVRVIAYDSAETFLVERAARLSAPLDDTGLAVFALITASNGQIGPGPAAFVAFVDENNDGRLNRDFLGKPKEPYRFSNNIKPKLSRPSFEDTQVKLEKGHVVVITIHD